MASLNKAMVIGRLGRDPEQRGSAATFSVATDYRTQAGDTTTEWFNCVAFGKTAEFVLNYLSKGREVYVEGRMKNEKWEKDGVTQRGFSIVANRVQALGPKPQSQQAKSDPFAGNADMDAIPF